MVCPQCGAEYREGFRECFDCKVALVKELPPEPIRVSSDLVTVVATGNPALVAVAKSLLADAGIPYHAKGERLPIPSVGYVELQVDREREEEARNLLSELDEDLPEDSPQQET